MPKQQARKIARVIGATAKPSGVAKRSPVGVAARLTQTVKRRAKPKQGIKKVVGRYGKKPGGVGGKGVGAGKPRKAIKSVVNTLGKK